jgi:light-regulated signal transduction histidine kinase (bacteriophytochrome)
MLVNARRLDHIQLILLGLRDITERKRTEIELRLVESELRTANEALTRANTDLQHFSYAVSHDMQESLRMVISFTQLLARDYAPALNGEANQYIDYAVRGASRMESMLKDLREYWSISQAKNGNLQPIDCNLVLDHALAYLEPALKESGAIVTNDHLPTILGEQYPLALLFQNLVGNAVKYRNPNRTPRIHVAARREDSAWVFSVTDNGIGMQPEQYEAIFLPFKRFHTSTHPGTGLGLAMCRRIVDHYQGSIGVESSGDEGSTFRITLPDGNGGV